MGKDTASFWAGIKKFEDILARDPNAYSFAPLAEIYRKLGLPDEALRIARRGVALHPDFAAGQMVLASVCLEKKMVAEAREALEVVVRITPENLDAQRLLADIHQAEGNHFAAESCRRIIVTLEPEICGEFAETEPLQPAIFDAAAEPALPATTGQEFGMDMDEDFPEADILELTDDLIEEEGFEAEPYSPFAAAPERPSLLAAKERVEAVALPKSVPLASPPPGSGAVGGSMAAEEPAFPVEGMPQPPMFTATIAELYVSQGLIDKGVEVYRELLRESPDNAAYRGRYLELTGGAPAGIMVEDEAVPSPPPRGAQSNVSEPVQSGLDPVATLEGWLGNIRRIRECRTETH